MIASGLPDTKRDFNVVRVRNSAELAKALRRRVRVCATAADDNGALNVWIDDKKRIRAEAYHHQLTIDSQIFKNVKEAQGWFAKWLKKIA